MTVDPWAIPAPDDRPVDMSPVALANNLARLGRSLEAVQRETDAANRAAIRIRADAERDLSKAFLAAEGSVDKRKHEATLLTYQIRLDAGLAEARVRECRDRMKAIESRIEVGRSLFSAAKAEARNLDHGATP